ncbi:MAG: TOBE domain-containing protein [Pseudomonadota bacterium]
MKTPSGLGAGEAVLAMIRPEKLRIDRTGTPARVTDVVFAGEKITYFLDSPLAR